MKYTCLLLVTLFSLGCGYGSNYMAPGNGGTTTGTGLPNVATMAPTSATAGGAAFVLTVNGTNFGSDAMVFFNGTVHSTTFVTANQVTANISASDIAMAGSIPVYVHSGVYNSNTVMFTVQ